MKTMSIAAQVEANAGSGYKCSVCGKRFYTYVIQKTPWWLPDVKSRAIDQCNLHIMTSGCRDKKGRAAKAKWCW